MYVSCYLLLFHARMAEQYNPNRMKIGTQIVYDMKLHIGNYILGLAMPRAKASFL